MDVFTDAPQALAFADLLAGSKTTGGKALADSAAVYREAQDYLAEIGDTVDLDAMTVPPGGVHDLITREVLLVTEGVERLQWLSIKDQADYIADLPVEENREEYGGSDGFYGWQTIQA